VPDETGEGASGAPAGERGMAVAYFTAPDSCTGAYETDGRLLRQHDGIGRGFCRHPVRRRRLTQSRKGQP
jgi:hypothetical protein